MFNIVFFTFIALFMVTVVTFKVMLAIKLSKRVLSSKKVASADKMTKILEVASALQNGRFQDDKDRR